MTDRFLPGRNIVGPEKPEQASEDYFNVRNPLRHYRSHSYHWIITAHNSLSSARESLTVEDHSATIGETTSSGGIVVVNELADSRVSVNELSWSTITTMPNDVTRGMRTGHLSLTEPYGVGLLQNIREWEAQLGTQFAMYMQFAARVIFVGHKDDGTSERLTGYAGGERALFFVIPSFEVCFTAGEGVSYMMPGLMFSNGGTLADGEYATIASLSTDRLNREEIEREQNDTNGGQRRKSVGETFASNIEQGTPMPAAWQDLLVQDETVKTFTKTDRLISYEVPGTDKAVRDYYERIKSGALTSSARVSIPLRDPSTGAPKHVQITVPGSTSGTPAHTKFAELVGDAFAEHLAQATDTSGESTSDSGLTDADDERRNAAQVRCETLVSISTVQDAFREFERALNGAALKWFESKTGEMTAAGSTVTPLRYEYEIRAEDDLGTYALDITTPKTQQALECVPPDTASETRNVAPTNITFDPHWTIRHMILHILSHSKQVADEVDLTTIVDGQPTRKATSKTVRVRSMRVSQGVNEPIKIIHMVSLADSAVPLDNSNLSTRVSGDTVLEYDFMYGNRYTDLIDFDMAFDWVVMYASRLLGGPGEDVLRAGDATRNVTAVVASTDAARTDESRVQASTGSSAAASTSLPSRSQAFLNSLGDMLQLSHNQVELKTVGDPFLAYDTMGDVGQFVDGTSPGGHYFTEMMRDPMRVMLNVRYPVFHSPRIGEPGTSPSAYTIESFWFDKPYHLTNITNSFTSEGGFVQTLSLMFPSTQDSTP